MTARNHLTPAFAGARLVQVALLLCGLGFPPALLAEPASFPGVPASPPGVSAQHPIEEAVIEPVIPRSSGNSDCPAVFSTRARKVQPGRSGEEKPSGGLDKV